jgi:hypothetical protein
MGVGNISVGNTNVEVFGPKLEKKSARPYRRTNPYKNRSTKMAHEYEINVEKWQMHV